MSRKQYIPKPPRFHVMKVDFMAPDIGDEKYWELVGSYKTKREARKIESIVDKELNAVSKKYILFIEEKENIKCSTTSPKEPKT